MLHAVKRHATSANTTARGSEPPANATPAGMDAAIAAPGAMSVMLWKRTSRRPIALDRSAVSATVASVTGGTLGPIMSQASAITTGQNLRWPAIDRQPPREAQDGWRLDADSARPS